MYWQYGFYLANRPFKRWHGHPRGIDCCINLGFGKLGGQICLTIPKNQAKSLDLFNYMRKVLNANKKDLPIT